MNLKTVYWIEEVGPKFNPVPELRQTDVTVGAGRLFAVDGQVLPGNVIHIAQDNPLVAATPLEAWTAYLERCRAGVEHHEASLARVRSLKATADLQQRRALLASEDLRNTTEWRINRADAVVGAAARGDWEEVGKIAQHMINLQKHEEGDTDS